MSKKERRMLFVGWFGGVVCGLMLGAWLFVGAPCLADGGQAVAIEEVAE